MDSTKEGIEVKPGQVWRDLDKRMCNRLVHVGTVSNGFAFVRQWDALRCREFGRSSRISVQRMHRHSTGFQLVEISDAQSVPDGLKSADASGSPKSECEITTGKQEGNWR